ncbi:MAG: ECF transporter S component [Eubacteriales bacterium]|nr:ECF transporter S component [Eubacteriales bacterium]
MFTETELDQFIDRFWNRADSNNGRYGRDGTGNCSVSETEYEEYEFREDGLIIQPIHKGRVEKRTWIALILFALTVPLILYLSVRVYHGRKYLLFSLLVILFSMVPFFLVFEGRKPQAREIMVIAVLAAIGVAGRAAFFMVPSFKPIAAVVILTGISFGGEAGFLVGCMIMMVSNMFFGQGPWTPWQMFSYGMIGFLAGILFQKGILKAKKLHLCIYGFLSVFFIFGGIMNPAAILMSYGYITKKSLIAFYISGAPVDLVQATSTVIFLWFMSRPLLEKLERIKRKYGLIQR